jgi:hypothetical protein
MLDICINGCNQGLWEGVLAGTSVQGPKSQEGNCESLKSPIAFAIEVLFWLFNFFLRYFQLFLVYLEK